MKINYCFKENTFFSVMNFPGISNFLSDMKMKLELFWKQNSINNE